MDPATGPRQTLTRGRKRKMGAKTPSPKGKNRVSQMGIQRGVRGFGSGARAPWKLERYDFSSASPSIQIVSLPKLGGRRTVDRVNQKGQT